MKENQRRATGFTLLEVMISIALLSVVAIYAIQFRIDSVKQNMAERIANHVMTVANISTTYYAANARWPATNNDDPDECSDLGTYIAAQGYVPGGLQLSDGIAFAYSCPDSENMGRTLRIIIGSGVQGADLDVELRDYLLGMLPNVVATTNPVGLVHYISPPRKLVGNNQFQRLQLGTDGRIAVDPPVCERADARRAILLPQAVCLAESQYGLGGFYFHDEGMINGRMQYQLRVAPGDNTNQEGDFVEMSNLCGGVPVFVGAITYCEPAPSP